MTFPMKSFELEKLYLDCIDNEGNCFILYYARLQIGFIRLKYFSLIFSDSHDKVIELSTLRKGQPPMHSDNLQFNLPAFDIAGSWKRNYPPIRVNLYKDSKGKDLIWNCHHPKNETEIIYKGNKYKGFGYAETLFLPVKPWELPIEELRWGRFLSETDTIIWIQWKGNFPVNKLFFNGIEYNDAQFTEEDICFGDNTYQLKFSQISILRKGKLSQVLSNMPWLKVLFRIKILNTLEKKCKAITYFYKNGQLKSSGWSLYEIVKW